MSFYVELEIPIEPVAAVRPKVTRWSTYYPGRYGKYLEEMRAWLNVHCDRQAPKETLLEVTAEFELSRPKSHYGTGRNGDVVKRSAPVVPHQDVDNLLKGLLDALTGNAYVDDKQVVEVIARKSYGRGVTVVKIAGRSNTQASG